jgi:hypothetical protein
VKGLLVHFEAAGQWLWCQCLYYVNDGNFLCR